VQVQRRVGTNVHEQAVVQERYVLKRRGAERPFPKGSDRAPTIAADQTVWSASGYSLLAAWVARKPASASRYTCAAGQAGSAGSCNLPRPQPTLPNLSIAVRINSRARRARSETQGSRSQSNFASFPSSNDGTATGSPERASAAGETPLQ
jgi:hypothetical protein